MTATILAFPRSSPIRALCRAGDGAAPFSPAWCSAHRPLIDAAMDLLSADDADFARRCALMADEEGRMIVGELAGQLQRLGAHIADVADALGLAAARIRDAMVAPS